jgi:hypothetical protein
MCIPQQFPSLVWHLTPVQVTWSLIKPGHGLRNVIGPSPLKQPKKMLVYLCWQVNFPYRRPAVMQCTTRTYLLSEVFVNDHRRHSEWLWHRLSTGGQRNNAGPPIPFSHEGRFVPVHDVKAFLASALDLDEYFSFTPRPLYHRERTPVPLELEAGLATQYAWTVSENRKSPFPAGIRTTNLPALSRMYYRIGPAQSLASSVVSLTLLRFTESSEVTPYS